MSVRKPTYEELAERVATLKSALDESGNAREQAEELLFSTLDALPSAIFTFDRAGVIAGWNKASRDVYGFEDEEVIGKTIYETVCQPQDAPATREIIERVFKGEKIIGLEWDDIRKNGATVHMQTTACPVLDRRGRVIAGMSVNTDVTEHHRAEAARRESEEQYRTLVENVNIGVYRNTGGPHGRFLQANLAIARMFGYDSVEEFMTVHVSDLYQDSEERKLFVKEALKRGFVKDQELRLRKKDGTPIWASCTAQIEYEENGEIKWFDGVIEDITERKQAERALKESEERYRALFEGAAEGILAADTETRKFKYANPALCSMLGYTGDELTQLGVDDIHPKEALEHVRAEFEAQVTGRKPLAAEIPCLRKDGTVFHADVNTTIAVIDGASCAIGFFRDVTQRREAEEKIRRLNADLEQRVTEQTEEVRESEERYRTLAESAQEFIFTVDRDSRIQYVNAYVARHTRRAAGTMIGRTLRDVFPRRAALTMEHHVQSAFKSEQPVHVEEEMRLTESADAPLCLDIRLVPLRDEGGEITAVLGIAHDITRRKQAEEALRRSEERMRSTFENALVGIYRTTPAGRILLANPALVRMLGFDSFEELAERNLEEKGYEPDYTRQEFKERMARDGKIVGLETAWAKRDGASLFVRESATAVRDDAGNILHYEGTVEDITARKRAEEAVRESEERYRRVVEDQTELICRFRPTGELTFVNGAYCRYFDKEPEDLIGRGFLPLIPEEDRSKPSECIAALSRDKPVGQAEHRVIDPDGGRLRWVRWVNRLIFDEQGSPLEYQAVGRDITREKHAEQALRRTQRERAAILNSMTEHVVYHDRDMTVVWANRTACDSVGLAPEEIVGKTCYKLWQGRSSPCDRCPVERTLEAGGPHAEEMATPDGKQWFVRSSPVEDENGDLVGVVEITMDITDRKRAEEALRESEERYRAIFEQAADSIILIDPETAAFVEFNDQAHTNLGYTRQEFEKLTLADIDVFESAADVAEHVDNIVKSGSGIFETKHSAKNGDVRDIEVNSRPVSIQGKSYIHAIWRDVTEAKRARERLEQQAKVLANVTDAVVVFAADRTVSYWNRAAERTYGYSAEEVVGGAGLMFLMRPQDDNDELADQIRQAVKTEGRWSHPRWPALTKDGREIWVNVTLSKLDIGTDEPPGTLVVARDVTEEVLLQERLIRTERLAAIGTLASGVAHEMNNLLGGLRGLADVAASDRDMVPDLIETARTVAVRGGAITARLTSLARADQPGAGRRIDLPSAVLIAVRMVSPLFGQRRINIEEYYGPTPQTWVSEGKIFQVLLNLLVNARDSIGRDGTVRVAVEHDKEPDEFVITVSDTGAGIEPEDIPRLFDPFFTTKRETGPEGEAPSHLGLGLPESLGIVRDCGGDITVESTPGHGATFTVRLPVRSAPAAPLAPAPPAEAMPEKGTPMLVADDDKLMRFWLTKHLEEQGYGVTAVDNGRGALDALAETPFPYVFLDLLMPGEMDGVATFRKLKETQPGAKVIIISAFTRDNIPKDCLDAAHAVLKKPFGTDDLARAFAGESTSA